MPHQMLFLSKDIMEEATDAIAHNTKTMHVMNVFMPITQE